MSDLCTLKNEYDPDALVWKQQGVCNCPMCAEGKRVAEVKAAYEDLGPERRLADHDAKVKRARAQWLRMNLYGDPSEAASSFGRLQRLIGETHELYLVFKLGQAQLQAKRARAEKLKSLRAVPS